MKTMIDERIEELRVYVDKQSELLVGINDAIENDGFVPGEFQQTNIDYICTQGRKALAEIERLEKLKKQSTQ